MFFSNFSSDHAVSLCLYDFSWSNDLQWSNQYSTDDHAESSSGATTGSFYPSTVLRYFFNTVFVSAVTTIATLITAILAAFALTSLEFKYKRLVIGLMISLLMVPYESIIFTNYNTICEWAYWIRIVRWSFPFWPVFLHLLFKWLFTKYFQYLYKAAKIDGASDLLTFGGFWSPCQNQP